jgi:hypothetical protein
MSVILLTLAVASAGFCVCLGVRIFNRRERWAKWTAVGTALLVAYPLSFGPACALAEKSWLPMSVVASLYDPLVVTEPSLIRDCLRVSAQQCGGACVLMDMTVTKVWTK